ncbi:MAG: carboxypeptidase regulatory-like domain-containing protein [Acidobacteriaceae bacterium]|nr:carboxypeptidase regulatory-like domain-containing protein [Acidobacteriaceae bacterium]
MTQAIVELIPCDPALDSRPQAPQALSTSIAARATGNINIAAPKSIGRDVCIIGAHVMGDAPAGRVYTDVYTTLKENPILVEAVTDTWTVALLNQASRLTHDPNRFDEFELRQLYAAGLISTLPASDPPPSGTGVGTPAADPSVGQACTPGDTDNSIQGLICSPTSGWVFVGPEILNGFKGNFIMDHGCGTIGQLLSSVHQLFSHTSTIVKNRVEVRHSTDSGDRIDDSVSLLSLKLDSNTLKYGYPGTAGPNQTYTIDQMVNQYTVTDPDDSNKVWTMGGELNPNPSQCTADTTAILPLVVRPAPDAPASLLQRVASVADHTNIDGHYRFFSYSRADELLSGSGWANGTVSTVCSSFDRLAAVNAGLSLHPTLQVPGVPDGMRQYSSEERTTGGNELFVADYNKVESKCNDSTDHIWFLQGLCDDLASNVANQVNNCFANDGCDDTSNAWQNPGVGIAVSPDDMLDWDTWHTGGTYGYNEPLVYQPKGYRHAYLWTASPGSGSLTIEVVDTNNHPFANATILVNTNAVGTTNSSGTFDIPIIPAGTYDIGAQFDPCAAQAHPNNCKLPLEQADKTVVLPKNGSITVSLVLCAGPGGTNCPQPGTKPTLNVGITETQTGPDVCFTGSGYTPSAPVQITYSNVPGRTVDTIRNFASESSGNLNVIDTTWDDYQDQYCSASQLDAQVTITALDNVSNLSVQAMVPAAYWCSQAVVGTNFNGGCH